MLQSLIKVYFERFGFIGLYFFLPISLHLIFLSVSKYNYPMADDSRIIGEFFLDYHSSDTFIGKLQAVFRKENEGSPALIRFIYLLSYKLTGKIEFKMIGIFANFLAFIPMYIIYELFRDKKKNLFLLLPIPYILLSTVTFFTFYYSFVTLFYIGSAVLPVLIFYQYFIKKSNFWVYFLLTILLFSSAVIIPTAGIVLLHAIYKKSPKNILGLGLFICFYLLLVKVILKSDNPVSQPSQLNIGHIFNNFVVVSKLFFITLGSWVFIFFKGKIYLSLFLGVCQVIGIVLLTIKYLKKDNTTTLFFFCSLLFISLLIFINIWFRWNENQEKYLDYIASFEKSFFIFLLLSLLVGFVFYYQSSKILAASIFILAFTTYFYEYYYSYSGWLNWYKTSLLSSVNRQWLGENTTPFRNNTQLHMYNKLIDSGFCQEESNVFTENKLLIEAYIKNKSQKQHFDLKMTDQDGRKEIVFYSFKNNFEGSAFNKLDGIYLLFVNDADKYIISTQFNAVNPFKAIFKQKMYSNWMSAQISNVLDEELKENEYDIYVLNVKQGLFASVFAIDKKLIKDNKHYNLVEISN